MGCMLDKTLPYFHVLMKREKGAPLQEHRLPDNFKFVMYKPGDEKEWARIVASVGEFDSAAKALDRFERDYMPYKKELERRCFFVENTDGKNVATLTIWWCYTGARRDPWIQWLAVLPEYQGLGLAKALMCEVMKRLIEIEGDVNVYLHTQTWSYRAINIYRKAGFKITREKGLSGYDNSDYEKAVTLLQDYLR